MNQQFELKLLLKQNSEMASRMQIYRRQNQVLIQRNQDLNLWVQNLSQVFAAIGASWKMITNNQEALFQLMKKRGDANSKSLITKYVSHFKTFDEIINNLGQKITNSGHSDQVTIDTKARLNAFVQNYQMFFREIVDSYFKFNDQYLQWLTELKNKPQLSQNFRVIANKQIQNKMKIKEFENFMGQFRGRFKIYQSQNQHKLLDGILFSKNQQINSLNQLNQKQTRRIQLMLNYSSDNAQTILQGQQTDYECFCGGIQLQYFKKQWQKHLNGLKNEIITIKNFKQNESQPNSSKGKEDYQLLEFQKQKLFDRITNLQGKIQKMKVQSKLTQQLVVNSSAYQILHSQTQQLLNFVDDLLHKITAHYNFIYEIQKSRQEEILQLKFKLQKTDQQSLSKNSGQSPKIVIESNVIEFKTNVTQLLKDLKNIYTQLNGKISQKQQILTKSKQYIATLHQQIKDLNKKLEQQATKNSLLQFRHQKFNEIQKKVTQILYQDLLKHQNNKQKVTLNSLWKQFLQYVKSRDKKIKDLQSMVKKKEKQVTTKDKLLNVLQQNLKQTEHVYTISQGQVKNFNNFIAHTEKQLHLLAQRNVALKTEFQQQKTLMAYKSKTQNQTKLKMEQKMRYYQAMQQQVKQLKKLTQQAQQNYENWILEQERKLGEAYLFIEEMKVHFEQKKLQIQQKEKSIKKINQQKQKWKSQCNKLGAKFNAIQQKSQMGVIKMELDQYKRKLMCNCSRDQERSVVLKTCPHTFCKKCIQDMNNSRNRKCPLCGIKFGKSDIHQIILS